MERHQCIDIDFRKDGLQQKLSNLYPNAFIIDDVQCGSMEGFLQSLKFENSLTQKSVCLLSGHKARLKGKPKQWWTTQQLYWQGQTLDRHSEAYQDLLDRAYSTLFSTNQEAQDNLLNTYPYKLTHSIGNTNPNETILTRTEFCSRLDYIRNSLRQSKYIEI